VVQEPSSGRGSVDEVPQKLKLLVHLHIIFCIFSPMQNLDFTDFCIGEFGTWASMGPWPSGTPSISATATSVKFVHRGQRMAKVQNGEEILPKFSRF